MAVKLNRTSYEHAKGLIRERHAVLDRRDDWSEHRPSAKQENEFLQAHGERVYRKWFLAVDDEHREGTKGRYKYPYGDFADVHRCGVISAESRAAQQKHDDVESAAAHLHGMLDALE
jgi:hypothetical protein